MFSPAGKSHCKRLKMSQKEAEELVIKAADSVTPEDEVSLLAPSKIPLFAISMMWIEYVIYFVHIDDNKTVLCFAAFPLLLIRLQVGW